METKAQVTHYCTRAQALKLVNQQPAGTHFAVMMSRDAPIDGEPGRIFPDGLSTCFSISRRDARKLTQAMLSEVLEARGARFPITITLYDTSKTPSFTLAYAAIPQGETK